MCIDRSNAASGLWVGVGLMCGALTACGGVAEPAGEPGDSSADSGSLGDAADAAAEDVLVSDVIAADGSPADATAGDAVEPDAPARDAAAPDVAADSTARDAAPDAAPDATVTRDAATPDAATPDATVAPDAATPDAGAVDAADARPPQDASPGSDSANAADACVDNLLCVVGSHWDPTACKCVPGTCISQDGGPCGGFTSNPCECALGLVCVTNAIPDIPGTCEGPSPVCSPVPCPSSQTWDSTLCECVAPSCTNASSCTGPLPQLCELCDGGGTGCAHWTCDVGVCRIAYCP
jgi:hypothetical protein